MTDYIYVWVRFRTLHASHAGNWEWREYPFPPSEIVTNRKRNKFFKDNYENALDDELSTQSEYWRGVEYEFPPVPRHIVEAKLKGLQWKMQSLGGHVTRLTEALSYNAHPVVKADAPSEKECRQWPRCGCLKQGRLKDCRPRMNLGPTVT